MDHDLTQQELARRAGTTPQVVSRLENGQHWPSLDTLRRVVEATGSRLIIGCEATASPGGSNEAPHLVSI